jgi:DNA polymerase-3 subunit epsilon
MKRVLIVDTETTGLDPARDRCIEYACILYDLEHAAPVASFSTLLPATENAAEEVNRIPVALLREGTESPASWTMMHKFAARAWAFVAHRAEFDRSFIPTDVATTLPWVCSKFHIDWPRGKPGDSLVPLALAHGLGVASAHRAMTDCDTLARLLTRVHEMGVPLVPLLERAMRPRRKVIALTSYDEREMTKAAGFAWDGDKRVWWREMPIDEIDKLPFATKPMESET